MKKIIFALILLIVMLTGCNKESNEYKTYKNYIKELNESNIMSSNIPFDIEVYTEKIIDNEITYRVIIDNPKEDIKNIEAIIIHDKYTEDIFPSTGIFDDKLNLIPETIDKDKNYVKGII